MDVGCLLLLQYKVWSSIIVQIYCHSWWVCHHAEKAITLTVNDIMREINSTSLEGVHCWRNS